MGTTTERTTRTREEPYRVYSLEVTLGCQLSEAIHSLEVTLGCQLSEAIHY